MLSFVSVFKTHKRIKLFSEFGERIDSVTAGQPGRQGRS